MEKSIIDKSIEWSNKHYGDDSIKQRYVTLFESLIKLGVYYGLNMRELNFLFQAISKRAATDFGSKKLTKIEIAEAFISFCHLTEGNDIVKLVEEQLEIKNKLSNEDINDINLLKRRLGVRG